MYTIKRSVQNDVTASACVICSFQFESPWEWDWGDTVVTNEKR